jgi:putative membrane protein
MDADSIANLWRFDPLPLAATFTAVLLYAAGTGPLRKRLTDGPFPAAKAALFYTGMGILTLMFMSPLHTLGEFFLLSAHMLTMMLVIFVVAPLVLLGLPGWLLAPVVLHPAVKPPFHFLTRPAVNLMHFNLAFLIVHIPAALKLLMFSTDVLHYLTYFAILSSALLMWWPVMNPLPQDLPGPGFKGQLIYLVVLLFAHNPFSSVFSYASGLIYPWYADAPRVFGLSPVQDQNMAGVLMGVVYMTALLIAAAVVFARWFEGGRAQARETHVALPPARLREVSPHE